MIQTNKQKSRRCINLFFLYTEPLFEFVFNLMQRYPTISSFYWFQPPLRVNQYFFSFGNFFSERNKKTKTQLVAHDNFQW